jgi:hypothetical protein
VITLEALAQLLDLLRHLLIMDEIQLIKVVEVLQEELLAIRWLVNATEMRRRNPWRLRQFIAFTSVIGVC